MGHSIVTALVALAVLAATATPLSFGSVHEVDLQGRIQKLLPNDLLISLLGGSDGEDEEYTKLERMLITAVKTFRDGLAEPQPLFGLPALDPFCFTDGKDVSINSNIASINATLLSVHSTGLSKFEVDKLSLYLVERTGVLDLTLPDLTFDLDLSVPEGSWVTPLKVPLHEEIKIKFLAPKITLGLRGVVSVEDGRLAMESTKINLDLGEWDFQIEGLAGGTCTENEGLCALLTSLIRTMAPTLIQEWLPVVEKWVNGKMDERLQELQISDFFPPGLEGIA